MILHDWLIEKDVEGRGDGVFWVTITAFAFIYWRKQRKISVGVAVLRDSDRGLPEYAVEELSTTPQRSTGISFISCGPKNWENGSNVTISMQVFIWRKPLMLVYSYGNI
jgi:hypothetical protein